MAVITVTLRYTVPYSRTPVAEVADRLEAEPLDHGEAKVFGLRVVSQSSGIDTPTGPYVEVVLDDSAPTTGMPTFTQLFPTSSAQAKVMQNFYKGVVELRFATECVASAPIFT